MAIKGMTTSLRWLSDLMSFFQTEVIKVPQQYREQVVQTKQLLQSDTSGFINTLLDFSINCAAVDYTIETNNVNLTESLNTWLGDINTNYRGRLPTGISALAKEYFRERWKGASNLVLRTFWEKKDGLTLPTTMFFVDGEDVVTERKNPKTITLGDEKYFIRIDTNKENNLAIPTNENELLFVQRPYDYWGTLYPVPYIIRKGLFRNLKFLSLMSEKGEHIVGKALEYLFLIKKGTENMAMQGRADMTYSADDLKKITDEFSTLLNDKKSETGTPTYATNFDTELEHMIPDYKLAVNEAIYAPIERKILAGLGLVDIVTGTSSNRREAMMNPKPFIAEIKQGVEDFKTLVNDILQTIAEKNKSHNKYFGGKSIKLKVFSGPVEHFIDDKLKDHVRSMYDRGTTSIETYNSIVGAGYVDHKVEVNRRKMEAEEKLEDLMYPHLIDNREGQGEKDVPGVPLAKDPKKAPVGKKPVEENPDVPKNPKNTKNPDKTGPEKKNFKSSEEDIETGRIIGEPVDPRRDYEEAPYKTNKDLPSNLKNLPSGAKTIWRKTFNQVHDNTGVEDQARQAAWRNVKLKYKKEGDSWVRKSQGEFEQSIREIDLDDIIEIKKLEILGKQNKILNKIWEESLDNENS